MSSAIICTDGYKIDHRRQYPKETKLVYSNFTPRKSRVPGVNEIVVFGIQAYVIGTLIKFWNESFFNQPFDVVGAKFLRRIKNYTSAEIAAAIGIEHIKELHTLGYLPLRVKALKEGTVSQIKVPVYTVVNTVDEFFWLTNYIETDMSCETWGPMTSATTAREYRKIFKRWADKTSDLDWFVDFQGHDFSYRGMFGREAAKASGAAHLISFKGTDTIPAIDYLEDFYFADSDKELVGTSVFATEHAVMCVGTGFYIQRDGLTWEKYGEAEFSVFKRLITELYPAGIVSIVSDTWNLWKVLNEYLPKLKAEILARNGKVVIRPDSGDPIKILTGWKKEELISRDGKFFEQEIVSGMFPKTGREISESERKGVIQCLFDVFGGDLNSKGYIQLNDKIGAIYGDSITLDRAEQICERLSDNRFASTNWVAGIGSYTYQYVTRDTFGFAMKATYSEIEIRGERVGIPIFKDPITDDGTKKSARGLMRVDEVDGKTVLTDQVSWEEESGGLLEIVFENSKLIRMQTLSEIREIQSKAA